MKKSVFLRHFFVIWLSLFKITNRMDDPKIFHIAEIVAKSLRTDLTEAEQAELEAWKNSSPERLRMVDEFSPPLFY